MLLSTHLAAVVAALSASGPGAWGEGGCDLAQGTAAAEAAPLLAPTLFGSVGYVSGGDRLEGFPVAAASGPSYRVAVGVSYSLGRLAQGLALRGRGDVACRRERARAALEAALAAGDTLGAERALAARAAVIEAALPEAERMIEGLGAAVREVRATVDALDADRRRGDELRALAAETSLALARATATPHPALAEVPALLAEYEASDRELGRAEASVRDARTWDVALRAGYDYLGNGHERVPFFATLSASFDLGRLMRGGAPARALEGRARAEHDTANALPARLARMLDAQRATLAAERARLASTRVLLADWEGQLAEVERLDTFKVERFRHGLWFELTRMRADYAYLATHVEDLARALAEERR